MFLYAPSAYLLDRLVRECANYACEYCRLPQSFYRFRFPVDHIIARQHGGMIVAGNLCLACPRRNSTKGPNIASRDSVTHKLVPLFHPRRHKWAAHFAWVGCLLVGKTPIGRVSSCFGSAACPFSLFSCLPPLDTPNETTIINSPSGEVSNWHCFSGFKDPER